MSRTKIEWATHTVNWLAGCTRISPACQHCYAEAMTARIATMPQAPARYRDGVVEDRRWTGRVSYDPEALRAAFMGLLQAGKSRRVFVNSMSDTFHADAPPASLRDLAQHIQADAYGGAIASTDHVIMLLTKRPDRLLAWQREHFPAGLPAWVWVGCTVEDQRRADERLDALLNVGAKVHYVSAEPLLGPLDIRAWFRGPQPDGTDNFRGLSWVIAGGESGPHARPSHPDWFRSLRDQCSAAGVAFHFKQWGEYGVIDLPDQNRLQRWGKHRAGRVLDGRTHDGLPEMRATR